MYIVLKADTDHLHITSFVTANEGAGRGGAGWGGAGRGRAGWGGGRGGGV